MEEVKKVNAEKKGDGTTVSAIKSKPAGPIPQFETSSKPKSTRGNKKRALVESDTEEPDTKRSKTTSEYDDDNAVFTQPALITGAKLKDYQLEGVAWMTGLFQNGISGILGTNIPYHRQDLHVS